MTKQKQTKQSYAERFLQQNAVKADDHQTPQSYAAEWLAKNEQDDSQPEAARPSQERPGGSPHTEPESQAGPETARKIRPIEALGPRVALSKRVERQLQRNGRELGMIRGNLSSAADKKPQTMYVSSCFDGEGKTVCSLNAAYGLSVSGAGRVLLVDGNVNHPRLHVFFSSRTNPGLVDVLDGRVALEQALMPTSYSGLDFLAVGDVQTAGPNVLSSERMKRFLDIVSSAYDYIIVDGASIFSSSEATQLAPLFDGMILAVACEQTKWEVVQSAEEKVRNAEGKLLGVALNRRKFHIPKRIYKWLTR